MNIGYACMIFSRADLRFSTCRLSNVTEERLNEIILKNLVVLDKMIDFNIENGIHLFRISSDVIPFATHPINSLDWKYKYREELKKIGSKIKMAGLRVSMHPGQYTVLNSPRQEVVSRAISDIHYHAEFLNALGVDFANKIILHVGGTYGDKSLSQDRFVENVKYLDSSAKKRLVIENDERSYTVQDVLNVGLKTGNPCVFDTFHHSLNLPSEKRTMVNWINICKQTWNEVDGTQKIHYSQQDGSKRRGAHSRSIHHLEFMEFYKTLNSDDIDIMLEVKDKEISAIKCINLLKHEGNREYMQKEWERYRILILSRSKSIYEVINQKMVYDKDFSMLEFYNLVDEALGGRKNSKHIIPAMMSVWSALEETATDAEKKKFSSLLQKSKADTRHELRLIKWLSALSLRQRRSDINESYFFLYEKFGFNQSE